MIGWDTASPPRRRIRVLIADDEAILRDALIDLITDDKDFEVVGAAPDAAEAISLAARLCPTVAIVDVRMPGGGPRAARGIRAASPNTRVLALSASESRETVFTMLSSGASGYIVKGAPASSILDAVRAVASGQASLSAEVARPVVEELRERLLEDQLNAAHTGEIRERIMTALQGDRLSCDYQPIVDLATGVVVGYEAFARFDMEPRRGPRAWLAEARAVGLSAAVDIAALDRAVEGLAHLPSPAFLCLNVNADTVATGGAAVPSVVALSHRLVFDINESDTVGDYTALHRGFAPLRAAGARLAVDDAGIGSASLRHLLSIDPEIIKLDPSITAGMTHSTSVGALARAIAGFAMQTGALILAEGIETEDAARAARQLGATYGQGWMYGRPRPLNECL